MNKKNSSNKIKKIHFGNLIDRTYFTRLFFVFVFISIILTYFLIDLNDTNEMVLIKFMVIIFLLMLFSVFLEMPKKSEYINLVDSIDLRHFFRNFIIDNGIGYAQKYDITTQKKINNLFKKGKKFNINSIIKKDNTFIITFHRDISNKNFIFGFLLSFKLHKIYVKDTGLKYQIIRLN